MQLKIPAPAQEPRTPGFSVLSGSELQVPPHAIQVLHECTQSVWCASAWLLRALQLGELQWVREGIAGMDGSRATGNSTQPHLLPSSQGPLEQEDHFPRSTEGSPH